jgi:hypothetical protein
MKGGGESTASMTEGSTVEARRIITRVRIIRTTITRTMTTHGMSLNIHTRNRKTPRWMMVAITTIKRHNVHRGIHEQGITLSIEE